MIQSVCLNIKFGGWLRGKWAGYYLLGISFYIENKFGYFYTHTIRPFYYIRTEYKEQTITVISNCWRNISSGERSYRPEHGATQIFSYLFTIFFSRHEKERLNGVWAQVISYCQLQLGCVAPVLNIVCNVFQPLRTRPWHGVPTPNSIKVHFVYMEDSFLKPVYTSEKRKIIMLWKYVCT